jgi:hypothetical protein
MGTIIPFRQDDTQPPRSFRELLERRVPVHVHRLLAQGGPQAADYAALSAFAGILGPRGDNIQFLAVPGTKMHKEVETNHEELARSIATLAFFPNGIRVFGLHIQVLDDVLSIDHGDGTPGEFIHPSKRKSTGSYYTPRDLIECLLDTALEPVMDDVIARSRYPRIQTNARRGILINLAQRIHQMEDDRP